jgi:hypothetical protein
MTAVVFGQSGGNPALEYYRSGAEKVMQEQCPLWQSESFSCKAVSRYYRYEDKKMSFVDSSIAHYFFTGSVLDSVRPIVSSGKKSLRFSFDCPNLFSSQYLFNFYPNDTGGAQIALGVDSPQEADSLPVGVAIINRTTMRPITLFLYYPIKEDYRRYSRTLNFTDTTGPIFPNRIVEIGVRDGLLSTETYRVEIERLELSVTN